MPFVTVRAAPRKSVPPPVRWKPALPSRVELIVSVLPAPTVIAGKESPLVEGAARVRTPPPESV